MWSNLIGIVLLFFSTPLIHNYDAIWLLLSNLLFKKTVIKNRKKNSMLLREITNTKIQREIYVGQGGESLDKGHFMLARVTALMADNTL